MNVTKNGKSKQIVIADLGKGAVLGKMEMSGKTFCKSRFRVIDGKLFCKILELISDVFRVVVSLFEHLKIITGLLDKFGLVSKNLRSFIIFQFLQKNHYYA